MQQVDLSKLCLIIPIETFILNMVARFQTPNNIIMLKHPTTLHSEYIAIVRNVVTRGQDRKIERKNKR